ncbi:hypothetical protein BT69DRAFT_1319980 [Atractiella rhizophila]|nr:hypothetical protein BT69DRAFT_1319980 [Atractiella rhizophila]
MAMTEPIDEAREELQELVKNWFIKWSTRNLDTSKGFRCDDGDYEVFWKKAWDLMTWEQKWDLSEHVQNTRTTATGDVSRDLTFGHLMLSRTSPAHLQSRCHLECLPQELLEMIMSFAIPEWDSNTFQLLLLSRALLPAVLRALCHTPPPLLICRDIHRLLNVLDRNPSLAPMIQHLRFAIHAEGGPDCGERHDSPMEKLSFIRLLRTCSHLKIFSVFSNFVDFLEGVMFDAMVSDLFENIPVEHLMIFDNGAYLAHDSLECFSSSPHLRSLDILRHDWQERGWQDDEFLDLPPPIVLRWPTTRSHLETFSFIFPPFLTAARMHATDYHYLASKTSLPVLLSSSLTSNANIELPKLRLLEVVAESDLTGELLLNLLEKLAGSLSVLRIAHGINKGHNTGGMIPSADLYAALNAIPNLRTLELQSFPLDAWDPKYDSFGPFTPTLRTLTLTECFGSFLDLQLWRSTFIKLPGNLKTLCLKGDIDGADVELVDALKDLVEEHGITAKWLIDVEYIESDGSTSSSSDTEYSVTTSPSP